MTVVRGVVERTDVIHEQRLALMPMLALFVPAAAAFIVLATFVTTEAAGFRPFALPPEANVAEALALGDAGQALAFITSGQDPNQRWVVREDLLESRELHVTAIQAAILSRHPELVGLLLRHGAQVDTPRGLACLAQSVDMGSALKPSTFGAPDGEYYQGPFIGGEYALARCGFPAD